MKKFFTFCYIFLTSHIALALDVSAQNWLEYGSASEGHSYFENRLQTQFVWTDFYAGFLWEALQPSRIASIGSAIGTDTNYTGFKQYYFRIYQPMWEVTAGSFTRTFGRGLVLDLYQRPDIQIDHHADGLDLELRIPYGIRTSIIGGICPWDNNTKIKGAEFEISRWGISAGTEYVRLDPAISASQELWGGYATVDIGHISLWAEHARKTPLGGLTQKGSATYISTTLLAGKFSLLTEFKNYNQFDVFSISRRYNNPPTLIREPTYTLQSLHIRELNPNDEIGGRIKISGNINRTSVCVDAAYAQTHKGQNKFTEVWTEIGYKSDAIFGKTIFDYIYKEENDTRNLNPIVDIIYEPESFPMAFSLVLEGQKVSYKIQNLDSSHYNFAGTFEVSTRQGSIGFEGGKTEESDFVMGFCLVDAVDGMQLKIGYGKRPGGFTCSGGVCRYEPPFRGLELKITATY